MKISRDIHPKAKLPDDKNARVWRYMDFWKFENLMKTKSLYLCRADNLKDRFEGTYSRKQIIGMNDWLIAQRHEDLVQKERERRRLKKRQSFISCWCMSNHDLDLMWKAYTKETGAVAIQSTVDRLERIADAASDYWPLDISMVTYVNHAENEHIDYVDGFDAFISKDVHFELDNEIRLIHRRNSREPTAQEVFLPVDLNVLIERIVLHPQFATSPIDTIVNLIQASGLQGVTVETSRDDRLLEE